MRLLVACRQSIWRFVFVARAGMEIAVGLLDSLFNVSTFSDILVYYYFEFSSHLRLTCYMSVVKVHDAHQEWIISAAALLFLHFFPQLNCSF
jgi:hypothetical protein